tara:strand:+ start:431 stop:712 length:282 start_codon:yes stop_codon:yes gene_type:complete
MSLTRKIQYKQSVRARKITEKNRLKKKIRDCLRKAERYKTSFNRYGKLQKRCKQMKGGYLSKKQSISGTRSSTRSIRGKRTRSKSKSINGKQP